MGLEEPWARTGAESALSCVFCLWPLLQNKIEAGAVVGWDCIIGHGRLAW